MCKVWPGLRCSDHPQQKLQKLGQKLHRTEAKLSALEEGKRLTFTKDGEPKFTNLTQEQAETERVKLKSEINEIQNRIDLEQCGYAMSAGGRDYYKQIAENVENPYHVRMQAAAVLNAAIERIRDQKDIGKVLKDEELSDDDKELYLHLQEQEQDNHIKNLEAERDALQQKLIQLAAQKVAADTPEKRERITKEQAATETRAKTVREKLKQRKAFKAEIRKFREARRRKIEARFNAAAANVTNFLRFVLQTRKPLVW